MVVLNWWLVGYLVGKWFDFSVKNNFKKTFYPQLKDFQPCFKTFLDGLYLITCDIVLVFQSDDLPEVEAGFQLNIEWFYSCQTQRPFLSKYFKKVSILFLKTSQDLKRCRAKYSR